jgi:SAM-dependent methyltransferase
MSSSLTDATNYHRWNYDWIAPYVRGRILDIGGGTGNHLAFLSQRELLSIDLSGECIAELRTRYHDVSNWSFEVGDITDPSIVERLGEKNFDTVLSCNVFEHIANDGLAFLHAARLLKPGGSLVLLLPAHPMLFGSLDRLAGHFRRYTRGDALRKLSAAGLQVVTLRYVNVIGAIGWFVNSRIRHGNLSSRAVNWQIRAFDRFLVPLFKRIEGSRSMPFGQSLLCVGRKQHVSANAG